MRDHLGRQHRPIARAPLKKLRSAARGPLRRRHNVRQFGGNLVDDSQARGSRGAVLGIDTTIDGRREQNASFSLQAR